MSTTSKPTLITVGASDSMTSCGVPQFSIGKRLRTLLAISDTAMRTVRSTLEFCGRVNVVATANNADHAVELALSIRPQLVVLQASMPSMNGVDVARRIREEYPAARIVILTTIGESVKVPPMPGPACLVLQIGNFPGQLCGILRGQFDPCTGK